MNKNPTIPTILAASLLAISTTSSAATLTLEECSGAESVTVFDSTLSEVVAHIDGAEGAAEVPTGEGLYAVWATPRASLQYRVAGVQVSGDDTLPCPDFFDARRVYEAFTGLLGEGIPVGVVGDALNGVAVRLNQRGILADAARTRSRIWTTTASDLADTLVMGENGTLFVSGADATFTAASCDRVAALTGTALTCDETDPTVDLTDFEGALLVTDAEGNQRVLPVVQAGVEISGLSSSYSATVGSSRTVSFTATPMGSCVEGVCSISAALYAADDLETAIEEADLGTGGSGSFSLSVSSTTAVNYVIRLTQSMGGEAVATADGSFSVWGSAPVTTTPSGEGCSPCGGSFGGF